MKPARFDISIPKDLVADMRRRLRDTHWANDFDNMDWSYGVERGWLMDMVDYWATEYDWGAQEAEMNRFDHFKVVIDDVPIHYMHVRGKGSNPKPIILTHGWPWTFWDWKNVVERLTDPARFGGDPDSSFDVVIPSLPGFIFSEPLRTSGLGSREIADLWCKLMCDVLGYKRFGAAGGDIGAGVSGHLGLDHPEHVSGILLMMASLPGLNPFVVADDAWAEDEQWMRERLAYGLTTLSHVQVQAAIPQTLAYGLADSPAGLAAWIWQKRFHMSDFEGDLINLYGRDFLCTTASLYWLTNTIASSMRYYSAFIRNSPHFASPPRIAIPTGFSIFPKDVIYLPRRDAEAHSNLVHWSIRPQGGHYAASEFPQDVAAEIVQFFGSHWRPCP